MRHLITTFILSAAFASSAAAAPFTWNLTSSTDCSNSGSNDGNTRTCASSPTGGSSVTASAWANTGGASNTDLETALLQVFGGGLGVRNRDRASGMGDTGETTSPQHAVDNAYRFDSIMFAFMESVALTSVNLGYVSNDSDFTLLAFTGAGAPTLAGATYAGLLASGWSLVGHYLNAGTGSEAVNAGATSARYWLIGARLPLGGGSADNYFDAFKIQSLTADTPNVQVPEPATFAILGLGLVGLARRLRRR